MRAHHEGSGVSGSRSGLFGIPIRAFFAVIAMWLKFMAFVTTIWRMRWHGRCAKSGMFSNRPDGHEIVADILRFAAARAGHGNRLGALLSLAPCH